MHEHADPSHPRRPTVAAGYFRVSDPASACDGQLGAARRTIERACARHGYTLIMFERDVQRAGSVEREGCRRIESAVRAGTVQAVILFRFDRFGRARLPWLIRAGEFAGLGVPVLSAQEGSDGEIDVRQIWNGESEAYGRHLAARVRPGKERGARAGIHQGPPPLGYTHPQGCAAEARHGHALRLAPDPIYAPIVREIFARYAAGGWSYTRLVAWLNSDPSIVAPPGRERWIVSAVLAILTNPIYCGLVRYNRRPEGAYERAAPGSAILVQGHHAALIDPATFGAAAVRRAAASTRRSLRAHGASLATGLFVCSSCGGPMTTSHQDAGMLYRCGWQQRRKGVYAPHTARAYAAGIAHEALLREVRRLRGPLLPLVAPQQPECRHQASGTNLHGAQPIAIEHLAARGRGEPQVEHLRMEIPDLIKGFQARDDPAGLRAIVMALVKSAQIVERLPERQPKWLRASVIWKPLVQAALASGALHLEPPALPPEQSLRAERHREAQRRYSERRRRARPPKELRSR